MLRDKRVNQLNVYLHVRGCSCIMYVLYVTRLRESLAATNQPYYSLLSIYITTQALGAQIEYYLIYDTQVLSTPRFCALASASNANLERPKRHLIRRKPVHLNGRRFNENRLLIS